MTAMAWFLIGFAAALAGLLLWQRLAGFGAQHPRHYADQTPRFDVRTHLDGQIRCEGVIYGPLGRVSSRFTGEFEAGWTGNRGVMKERFLYDSGSTQTREWRLELGNDGTIRAEADDLAGPGRGIQRGPAVRLDYRLRLPDKAGGHVLAVTDWMYLTPTGAIVNRSQFRKFGIKVAELVATMQRVDTA